MIATWPQAKWSKSSGFQVLTEARKLTSASSWVVGVTLALFLLTPGLSRAASVNGGSLNAPGERSHNVVIGWPEVSYLWEGLVQDKVALGPRVGLQIWPLSVRLGLHMRFTIVEKGRVSLALLLRPAFSVAGFGGSRAVYPQNYQWGRSRTFRPSLGPGLDAGILASIDVSPRLHVLVSLENPLALWFWTSPLEWWIEWPIVLSAGLEYEISYKVSLLVRFGGGPAVAFAGPTQLLGVNGHADFGVQVRY